MDVVVRPFERADQDAAVALFQAGLFMYAIEGSIVKYMEHQYFKINTQEGGDMHDIQSYYSDSPNRCFFVAVVDGTLAGIVAGIFRQEANEVELQRMSVHADFRRRGAGRKLVEAVCNWARNKGSEQVVLGTLDRKTSAIGLYKACGFKQTSSKPFEKSWFKSQFGVETDEVVNLLHFAKVLR